MNRNQAAIGIYSSNTPKKDGAFSVLNDTPLNYNESVNFKNFGLKLNYNNFIARYGNWNQWWGPGVHNSLIMTNNSKGFYHTFIGTKNFIPISSQIRMKFKYMFSNPMINKYNENYYLSIWQSQLDS